MSANKRTQKQISERLADNLSYYVRPHYWRRLRSFVTWLFTFLGIGAIVWFAKSSRETGQFYTPGPLTQAHVTLENNCFACHAKASLVPKEAFQIDTVTLIDNDCQKCHEQRGGFLAMHQPNASGNTSCSACHREHVGPGPMSATTDLNCAACHDSKTLMEVAEIKGMDMRPSEFPNYRKPGIVYFPKQRPENGYTKVFKSFWEGHPEFYFNKPGVRDPNPLRYNHSIHIRSPNIPPVNGQKLDCAYCHTPDRDGEGFIPVKFETNCRACHALKFDADFPELNIPHADPSGVRSFLRAIPVRYRDYALNDKGMTAEEANQFALKNSNKLRDRFAKSAAGDWANFFENLIFFGDGRNRPEMPSCNYCHVVVASQNSATPQVEQTKAYDRFFQNGKFDHQKHTHLNCVACHDAPESRQTSDLMMPSVKSCAECHSPAGFSAKSGVAHNCTLCHEYHAPAPLKNVRSADAAPTARDYMLAHP